MSSVSSEATLLDVRGVRLHSGSDPIDVRVIRGESCALMGPEGSGKSFFVSLAAGRARPSVGNVQTAPAAASSLERATRRSTPQSFARSLAGRNSSTAVAEALTDCGLWESRHAPLAKASPATLARTALLPLILASDDLLCTDGGLDHLDPWSLSPVLEALMRRVDRGASLLVSTCRADIAARMRRIIVLDDRGVAFDGSPEDLRAASEPAVIEFQSSDPTTARAIVEPFAVRFEESHGGFRVETDEGQALAAKLLLAGYGSVRSIEVRRPSLEEALRALLERPVRRRTTR